MQYQTSKELLLSSKHLQIGTLMENKTTHHLLFDRLTKAGVSWCMPEWNSRSQVQAALSHPANSAILSTVRSFCAHLLMKRFGGFESLHIALCYFGWFSIRGIKHGFCFWTVPWTNITTTYFSPAWYGYVNWLNLSYGYVIFYLFCRGSLESKS